MELSKQNAVVVGGGSGMGEAIALGLAAEGATVVVAGRRQAKLDEVATQADGTLLTHTVDVSDRDSVKTLFDWVSERLGQLHLLVNCAGANVPKRSMSELAPDDWDKLMAINATGAFNCMHYALPLMRPHKTGLVINISSTSGKRAAPLGGVAYNASKFAMAALGTSANEDERENGIRVTTIFPGEVDTPILSKRPVPPSAEHRAKILKPATSPTSRWPSPSCHRWRTCRSWLSSRSVSRSFSRRIRPSFQIYSALPRRIRLRID